MNTDDRSQAHRTAGAALLTMQAKAQDSAVTTAFSITEVVENILYFLPMKDLLLDQRVRTVEPVRTFILIR